MNKIDFVGFVAVNHANPNGDPMTENLPRIDSDDIGEISQVCLKRKIRNRLLDAGESILVQSNDNAADEYTSIEARLKGNLKVDDKESALKDSKALFDYATAKWLDVRAFGQVFAFKSKKKDTDAGVSCHVRGCMSISSAFSIDPIDIEDSQIVKSTNGCEPEEGKERGSDTMGSTHRVKFGVYRFHGSICPKFAEKNGLTEDDVTKIKTAISTMFENDAASARPAGSMDMFKIYFINHSSEAGDVSVAKINQAIKVSYAEEVDQPHKIDDYVFDDSELNNIKGITVDTL